MPGALRYSAMRDLTARGRLTLAGLIELPAWHKR